MVAINAPTSTSELPILNLSLPLQLQHPLHQHPLVHVHWRAFRTRFQEPMTSAAATRLPPELLASLVTYLEPHWLSHEPRKRGMATCSLVCRYWATLLRQPLLRVLTVRTPADASFLLAIIKCPARRPGPPVGDCVRRLTIKDFSGWDTASVRTLSEILRLCTNEVDVPFTVFNAQRPPAAGGGISRERIPFAGLPRPVPSALVFTQITLWNVLLQSQSALIRVLGSSQRTARVSLHRVTFVSPVSNYLRRLNAASSLRHVLVMECGDGSALAQIELATAIVASQQRLRVDRDGEWAVAARVLRLLLLAVGCQSRDVIHVSLLHGKHKKITSILATLNRLNWQILSA